MGIKSSGPAPPAPSFPLPAQELTPRLPPARSSRPCLPQTFVRRFCIMDRVAMHPRLSLCVLLLLSLWHGVQGARILRAGVQGQLPPCKDVPGGIQNWDCYDPPSTPLPPCDFKHHSPGIDCNTDGQKPPSPKAKLDISVAGGALTHHGVQGQLPPCKDVPGGIQNWDCYDPPSTPLPPCDFKHQNPGIDCNTDGQKPPSPKAKLAVTDTDILVPGDACAGSDCWLRAPLPGALP